MSTAGMNTPGTSTAAAATLDYDVVIVGGGPGGLATAVALGRSLRSVLVVDAGEQRNLPSDAAHNVLAREGISPADLVGAGRREAASYGVDFADTRADGARRDGDGFVVDLGDGRTAAARRLVLATGLVDELPDIDGVHQGWGHSVLHCPYCHGYEVRDRRVGVLATMAPQAVHQSLLFSQLTSQITLFTAGVVLDEDQRAQLDVMGVTIVDGTVDRLDFDGRQVRAVVLAGDRHEVDAVVVGPRMVARGDLYEQLGGELADHVMGRYVPTQPGGATPVDGVWAVGNSADLAAMVASSAGTGVAVGAAINADLLAEDVRVRLAAR